MNNSSNKISLPGAAVTAGVALLILAICAPVAEFFIMPSLIVNGNPAATVKNISIHQALLGGAVCCYLLTFIGDVVVAWALYILLEPVNKYLSLLAALFRLIYAVAALVALLNLVTVFNLLNSADLKTFNHEQLYTQIMFALKAFSSGWSFSILIFGIHLLLIGYLIFRSDYIPSILGILLCIAGLGWLAGELQPFLLPGFKINFVLIAVTGSFELIFMLWLLIKGAKIRA